MKLLTVALQNEAGCYFDACATSSAKAAVNFCKGRGGTYTAYFEDRSSSPDPLYSVRVAHYNGRTTFSEYVIDRRARWEGYRRISAAALAEKLNNL